MHIGTARVKKENVVISHIPDENAYSSEFTNELGNSIKIRVVTSDHSLTYTMTGPTSSCEVTVTTLEAIELMVMLGKALGLNIVVTPDM